MENNVREWIESKECPETEEDRALFKQYRAKYIALGGNADVDSKLWDKAINEVDYSNNLKTQDKTNLIVTKKEDKNYERNRF